MSNFPDIQTRITGDEKPLLDALERAKQAAGSAGGAMGVAFDGATAPLAKLLGMVGKIAAVFAGGALFSNAIDETRQFHKEARQLAEVMGVGADEAAKWIIAVGDVGGEAGTLTAMTTKLAQGLRENESAMNDMGMRTRDANGQLRPMSEQMLEAIRVVNDHKVGIDREVAAQELFGRSLAEVRSSLKLTSDRLEETAEKQKALGLNMTEEGVAANKAYGDSINDVGDVMLAIKKVIGDAVMPLLTHLANWFSSMGPDAVQIFKRVMQGVMAVFWTLVGTVETLWHTFDGLAMTLKYSVTGAFEALSMLLGGDVKGAVARASLIPDAIAMVWKSRGERIADTWKNVVGKLTEMQEPGTLAAAKKGGGTRTIKKKDDGGGDAGSEGQMAAWKQELDIMKEAHARMNAENKTFTEFSKERELAFWQGKLAMAGDHAKDAAGAQQLLTKILLDIQDGAFQERLAQLQREQAAAEGDLAKKRALAEEEQRITIQRYSENSKQAQESARKIEAIEREAVDQRRRMREIGLAEIQAAGNASIDLARTNAMLQRDLGIMSSEEYLELERRFEESRSQIAMQAAQARLAIIDPAKDPVEYRMRSATIEQLELEHQNRLAEIQGQAARQQMTHWQGFFQSMESGFARVIGQFLSGTKTLAQTVRGLFVVVGQSILQMIAQMAARWLATQIMQRVMGKVTGYAEVARNAAVAGSGAYAAIAAIPYVGPFMAPAAASTAYAGAMSFAASIPAAAKGWDIPAGINPITQLHEKEMVLPAEHADAIRGMTGQGGGVMNFNVSAVDAKSVQQLFRDNGSELAKVIRAALREGA